MNLKEIKQPFEVEELTYNNRKPYFDVICCTDKNKCYGLLDDADKETCEIVAALLNMYCFSKIDLTVLDINRLNRIVFLMDQINQL